MMRKADDQPSVKALMRADPIVHYTLKYSVNGHAICNWHGRFPNLGLNLIAQYIYRQNSDDIYLSSIIDMMNFGGDPSSDGMMRIMEGIKSVMREEDSHHQSV